MSHFRLESNFSVTVSSPSVAFKQHLLIQISDSAIFFSIWWFHVISWLSDETSSLYWGMSSSLYKRNFSIHSGLSSLLLMTIRHLLTLLCSSRVPYSRIVGQIHNTVRNFYVWKKSIVDNSCYLKSIYLRCSTFIKYFYKI